MHAFSETQALLPQLRERQLEREIGEPAPDVSLHRMLAGMDHFETAGASIQQCDCEIRFLAEFSRAAPPGL